MWYKIFLFHLQVIKKYKDVMKEIHQSLAKENYNNKMSLLCDMKVFFSHGDSFICEKKEREEKNNWN